MGTTALSALTIIVAWAATSGVAWAAPMALWRGAQVGMTVAEVQRVVPEARAVVKPDASKEGWLDLLEARVRAGGHDQKASFQFQEGRLAGVVVAEGAPMGLAPLSDGAAAAIRADLTRRHGAPVRCRLTDDGFTACFWIEERKFIGYFERPAPTPAVLLFFHEERPDDRNLLLD